LKPTGSSSAGVGTAVVDLRILPDIRNPDSLTYLVGGVVYKKEERVFYYYLLSARRREAYPSVDVDC
jgi:hypothetical protein